MLLFFCHYYYKKTWQKSLVMFRNPNLELFFATNEKLLMTNNSKSAIHLMSNHKRKSYSSFIFTVGLIFINVCYCFGLFNFVASPNLNRYQLVVLIIRIVSNTNHVYHFLRVFFHDFGFLVVMPLFISMQTKC